MNNLNFKDLVAKVKGLPTRTKNIILLIIGIFIFILTYTMGFQKIQEKTAAVQAEVDSQASYVSILKDYHNNLQTYENGIAADKDSINLNLSHLPRGIKTEDFLMYIKTMNEKLGCSLESVSFEDDSYIGEFACVVDDKNVTAQSMHSGAKFTNYLTYAQVKNLLKYVYEETPELTFVDSVSLTYDSEIALLQGDIALSKFYITYEESQYVPVPVPDVSLGVGDPFGTVSK